jgi:hypothetical protein
MLVVVTRGKRVAAGRSQGFVTVRTRQPAGVTRGGAATASGNRHASGTGAGTANRGRDREPEPGPGPRTGTGAGTANRYRRRDREPGLRGTDVYGGKACSSLPILFACSERSRAFGRAPERAAPFGRPRPLLRAPNRDGGLSRKGDSQCSGFIQSFSRLSKISLGFRLASHTTTRISPDSCGGLLRQ